MATANPCRFSTKFQDDETGLLYYGYRYYDPSTGRWNSTDPLSQDPLSDDLGDNLDNNAFVQNDPVGFYDYLGNQSRPSKSKPPSKKATPKKAKPLSNRCNNDVDCMRCLLFHEGRGKSSACLKLQRDAIINRAKELGHGICDEAESDAYANLKKKSSNYQICCRQNWCADKVIMVEGKPSKPFNPDKEDASKIDDFMKANPGTTGSENKEVIRFHDTTITRPKSWSDSYVEVPTPECKEVKFYKKVLAK